ncbi:uncharacterized protein LOC135399591 isoform X4 [Ornithodoros turicata]|uniref:uncharacterized protein LOC135399591 isoform X4 n=1 Tax=Ornithodoros turicata TaxID=34597 RepID=UPI0031394191
MIPAAKFPVKASHCSQVRFVCVLHSVPLYEHSRCCGDEAGDEAAISPSDSVHFKCRPLFVLADMSSRSRGSRTTVEQYEIMARYMQKNESLFRGTFSSEYTTHHRDRDWTELAERLNAAGGAVKTVEKWRKAWQDWKSHVKAKAARIGTWRKTAGAGKPCKEQLTPVEEILACLLGEVCIVGVATVEDDGHAHACYPELPSVSEQLVTILYHGDKSAAAQNGCPPTSEGPEPAFQMPAAETAVSVVNHNVSERKERSQSPQQGDRPPQGRTETQESRPRRRWRIRALRQQYRKKVSLQATQRQQRILLGEISGSLRALVTAVNRIAAAAEQQATTLQEIKALVSGHVRTHRQQLAFYFGDNDYATLAPHCGHGLPSGLRGRHCYRLAGKETYCCLLPFLRRCAVRRHSHRSFRVAVGVSSAHSSSDGHAGPVFCEGSLRDARGLHYGALPNDGTLLWFLHHHRLRKTGHSGAAHPETL